jgi:hypothetical protein
MGNSSWPSAVPVRFRWGGGEKSHDEDEVLFCGGERLRSLLGGEVVELLAFVLVLSMTSRVVGVDGDSLLYKERRRNGIGELSAETLEL